MMFCLCSIHLQIHRERSSSSSRRRHHDPAARAKVEDFIDSMEGRSGRRAPGSNRVDEWLRSMNKNATMSSVSSSNDGFDTRNVRYELIISDSINKIPRVR